MQFFLYNLIGPQVCISSLTYCGLFQLWQMAVQYVSSRGRLSLLEVIKPFAKKKQLYYHIHRHNHYYRHRRRRRRRHLLFK